jgi:hypothetical protein
MVHLFASVCEAKLLYIEEIDNLHEDASLMTKIKIFVSDFMTSANSKEALARITEDPKAHFFFSGVYFTKDEAARLLAFPTPSGLSVFKYLQAVLSKKYCKEDISPNDLVALLQEIFDIEEGFQEEITFKIALRRFKDDWRNKARK